MCSWISVSKSELNVKGWHLKIAISFWNWSKIRPKNHDRIIVCFRMENWFSEMLLKIKKIDSLESYSFGEDKNKVIPNISTVIFKIKFECNRRRPFIFHPSVSSTILLLIILLLRIYRISPYDYHYILRW